MLHKFTVVSILMVATLGFGLKSFATIPEAINDSAITAAVKAKMITDKQVSALNIKVETEKSVVSLAGKVPSDQSFNRAIEITCSISGVKDVNTTKLEIHEKSHPIDDAIITAKVKGMFAREKIFGEKPISLAKIHVETKNGIVLLTGKVEDAAQIETAKNLAMEVKAVKGVESSLAVE
jgi:hyperosmotically inducible protein